MSMAWTTIGIVPDEHNDGQLDRPVGGATDQSVRSIPTMLKLDRSIPVVALPHACCLLIGSCHFDSLKLKINNSFLKKNHKIHTINRGYVEFIHTSHSLICSSSFIS